MGTKSRRLREKENRINEIRAAAKKVFFEKGYKHATIDEIAAEAEVSKGTIYLYFKTKDELYIYLMMPALEELGRRILLFEETLTKGNLHSGHEVVRGLLEVLWGIYEYDPEGIRIVQVFYQGEPFFDLSEEVLKVFNDRAKTNFEICRRVIDKAVEMNLLRKVDSVKLVDMVWAMFIGIIQLEEAKLRVTKKNHIFSTYEFAFSFIDKCLAE